MPAPLSDVRVVVLAGMGPVPYLSMLLADMGAHVVRVDRPAHRSARALNQTDGLSAGADPVNRHVDAVEADLKDPDDVEAVVHLAAQADIFIEGFRPGTTERMGLGPDVLLERAPHLVYVRLTGYGQTGSRAHEAGHDINYVAQSGALSAFARQGEAPLPPVNLLGDYAGGGAIGAFGVVCALHAARNSGQGQVVDCAMVDGVALLTAKIQGLRAAGLYADEPGTNFLDSGAPYYDSYRCADGRYVAVGALEADFYREFLARLDTDTSQWPAQNDRESWPELRRLIAEALGRKTRSQWAAIFEGSDACVTPVHSFDEAAADPHNAGRGVFTRVDGVLHPAPAPRLSETPALSPETEPGRVHTLAGLRDEWGGAR